MIEKRLQREMEMEENKRIREHEKEMAKLSLTIAEPAASASPPIGDTFRVENASKLLPKLPITI